MERISNRKRKFGLEIQHWINIRGIPTGNRVLSMKKNPASRSLSSLPTSLISRLMRTWATKSSESLKYGRNHDRYHLDINDETQKHAQKKGLRNGQEVWLESRLQRFQESFASSEGII